MAGPSVEIIYVVMKALPGLEPAEEFLGAFRSREQARAACIGAGTFRVASLEPGRRYRAGELLDVEVVRLISALEL